MKLINLINNSANLILSVYENATDSNGSRSDLIKANIDLETAQSYIDYLENCTVKVYAKPKFDLFKPKLINELKFFCGDLI